MSKPKYNYFEISQQVKAQVEGDLELIEIIKNTFQGKFESFDSGTNNRIYSLGKTKSGLYLALRKTCNLEDGLDYKIKSCELYCQGAEIHYDNYWALNRKEGPRTVAFCVGVISDGKHPAILTEDVSEGGIYDFDYFDRVNRGGPIPVIRKKAGTPIDKVMVDMDFLEDYQTEVKYFSRENRIEI